MKITIIGQVCIDINTSEHTSYISSGSPAMFMNTIFKQLPNNQITIISPYGRDFLPYKKDANIFPKNPTSDKTLIYENIIKSGARQQKALNREFAKPVQIDAEIKKILTESEIVFIAPLLANYSPEYLKNLLSFTKQSALKVLLPQGYYRDFDLKDNMFVRPFEEANEILPLVDIVIVSEKDHENIFSKAKEWANNYKIMIIITLGAKGAIAITSDKEIQLQARIVPENEIIDSVGAGDIFSAGFAYWYKQTKDLKNAGRFANELARQSLFYPSSEIKIDYQALIKAR